MMILDGLLAKSDNPQKDAYFWNALSACLNSFQTMLLLLALTHFGTDEDSSIFVMAYAIGNLLLHVGKFGVRQFQVTDVNEVYSFAQYKRARLVSLAFMLVALAGYITWGGLANGYSLRKTAVIILITLFKGIEAAEDVLHGRMQQLGRLDIAAKILAIRLIVFIVGFATVFLITCDLLLTAAINVLITLVLAVALNRAVIHRFQNTAKEETKRTNELIWDCVPLCLTNVMLIYLNGAPKYAIDGLVSDSVQTGFNIVFMPAFVVALLSNFIFNPVLKKIGVLWSNREIKDLNRMVLKLALIPIAIDIVVVIAGRFLGPPILGFVYGVDVYPFTGELLVFLIASGIMALQNLFVALLTTMRKQHQLMACYAGSSLAMVFLGRMVLRKLGLLALCWVYLFVLVITLLITVCIYLNMTHKQKTQHVTPIDEEEVQ